MKDRARGDANFMRGNVYDDLAAAILDDRDAPPFLAMAAFLYKWGAREKLVSLVDEAAALSLSPDQTEEGTP